MEPSGEIALVYAPDYEINAGGLERLHPFDTRKASGVWSLLRTEFGAALDAGSARPAAPASLERLSRIHPEGHLQRIPQRLTALRLTSFPLVLALRPDAIDRMILLPHRWQAAGTALAVELALRQHRFTMNLGGGFHHAEPDSAEGFCAYNDIALGIVEARENGWLGPSDTVAVVDLDAHQGNGVARCFLDDRRVRIFDMHRPGSYLRDDWIARARIDAEEILPAACGTRTYLARLQEALPRFLDGPAVGARLVVYNAGTDILAGDPVGHLWVDAEGVRRRDAFVMDMARARGIPLTALPSGGYTRRSRRHVHALARAILESSRLAG